MAVAHLVSGPARERRAVALRPPAAPAEPVTVVRPPAPQAAEAAATVPTEPVGSATDGYAPEPDRDRRAAPTR